MAHDVKSFQGVTWASITGVQGRIPDDLKSLQGVDVSASGGTPPPVSGYITWWAADNITGLSDADPVSSWNDASGNAIHATQSTGGLKPTYQTNELNGLPVVRFDGSDRLVGSSASLITLSRSVFVVAKQTTATGEDCIFDVGNWMALTANGSSWTWYGTASEAFTGTNLAWSVVSVTQDSSSGGEVYVDGAFARSLLNSGTGAGSGSFAIGDTDGSALFFTGDIAEIIIYPSKLSSPDRISVENYLSAKYAL